MGTAQEKNTERLSLFAARLRWQMGRVGLQGNELAERIGVEPSAVSNWLQGKNRAKGKNLRDLAVALGCSIDFLNGEDVEIVGELAPLREMSPRSEVEIWKRRAVIAEKKLTDLRTALRSMLDLSSDSPTGAENELVSMLRAAGDQADAELEAQPPKPATGAPSGGGPSRSATSSPGTKSGTPHAS